MDGVLDEGLNLQLQAFELETEDLKHKNG